MKTNSLWAALKVTLPICAGIAAGISSSLLVSHRGAAIEQKPTTFAEQQAPRNTPAATREDTQAVRSRLAAVEQEVKTLRDKQGEADEATEAQEPLPPSELHAEREAQMKQASQEFQAKVALHHIEPMDPSWAEPAARTFETEIRALIGEGKHSEEFGKVECRTSSCVAKIAFPSYNEARQGFARYASNFYDIPCARSAVLDEPEDPTAPYDVEILFSQCQRQ